MKDPKCLRCKHYFATHAPLLPRGCRAYRFRSVELPSAVVKRETGSECLAYEERPHFKRR